MINKNFGFGTQIRKSPYFDEVRAGKKKEDVIKNLK